MDTEIELATWEKLRDLAQSGEAQELANLVDSLGPREALRAILRLDLSEQETILTTLSPPEAADLIEDIPDEHAADLIENLDAGDAALILNEMQSDEQADVLGDLDVEDAEAILAEMEPSEANDARRLAAYPDDVAGGLMVTEFISYPEETPAGTVIDDLEALTEGGEEFFGQYIYVASQWRRLIGVLPIRSVLLSPRATPLAEIMVPSLFVSAVLSLDGLREFFDQHDFAGVPIVNEHGRLVGVVTRNDVLDAVAERAELERLKIQGIVGGDEIRTMPATARARRRLSWLSVNILLNLVAASVIAFYLDTLQAAIALAVFLPIVSDMSGCSGNQAVAVSLRELTLGIVKPFEVVRVWMQEVKVGLINGVVLGLLLACVAWIWKGNIYLGLVVGSALAVNTMVSVSIGGTIPLILKWIGVDPAVASGPILTTITDMVGFFLVLSFGALLLPKLLVV